MALYTGFRRLFMRNTMDARKRIVKKDKTRAKIEAKQVGRTAQRTPKLATAGSEVRGEGVRVHGSSLEKHLLTDLLSPRTVPRPLR